jgi:hypothetical protein
VSNKFPYVQSVQSGDSDCCFWFCCIEVISASRFHPLSLARQIAGNMCSLFVTAPASPSGAIVGIADNVQRPNHVTLNFEGRSLHRPLGCLDDDSGQTIDDRNVWPEVFPPPCLWAFTRGVNQER